MYVQGVRMDVFTTHPNYKHHLSLSDSDRLRLLLIIRFGTIRARCSHGSSGSRETEPQNTTSGDSGDLQCASLFVGSAPDPPWILPDPPMFLPDPPFCPVLALCVFDYLRSREPRATNPFIILKGEK